MIVISGTLTIDPAQRERMIELTQALEEATRAEAGNHAYEYSEVPGGAGVWRVFEEWEDDDALNAHMGSAHMAQFLGAAADLGISAVDLSRYDVRGKSKFM